GLVMAEAGRELFELRSRFVRGSTVRAVELVPHRLPASKFLAVRGPVAVADRAHHGSTLCEGSRCLDMQAVEAAVTKPRAFARDVHQSRSIRTTVHGQTNSKMRVSFSSAFVVGSVAVPRSTSLKHDVSGPACASTAGQRPWSGLLRTR